MALNEQRFSEGGGPTTVRAMRCLWDAKDLEGTVGAALAANGGPYDFVVGADCLFFEAFHRDLAVVLDRLLTPEGRAVLCQPSRNGSMERFLDNHASDAGRFVVTEQVRRAVSGLGLRSDRVPRALILISRHS